MVKNHEIIDRTNDIIMYVLDTLKDFDSKANEKSIYLKTMNPDMNIGIDVAIRTLQLIKDTVGDEDYNTRAKYFKEILDFALESYINNLHGCEYATDKEEIK
ncbi:hypothetical protein [Clostridium sp.]|uniref:hypothetical protein n=1 Tax=Clostridium sp. TaxID=1506 RepID=UPI00262335FE|nr:hypothetical protein [Clostridium sp.]